MVASISKEEERKEFSIRLNHALDGTGISMKGQGRQTEVAKLFDVSQGASRKWLEGSGYPGIDKGIEIARKLEVRFEWLFVGKGPMTYADSDTQVFDIDESTLEEAIVAVEDAEKSIGTGIPKNKKAKIIARIYLGAVKGSGVDYQLAEEFVRIAA